jgi:hypothetical protein
MKMKPAALSLLGIVTLLQTGFSSTAAPLRFYFSGQITQTRPIDSVFTGGVGSSFSGYFSYDTAAADLDPPGPIGFYPLLEFSVDGKSLNVATGSSPPFIPGVIVQDGGLPGLPDMLDFRGFYLPALGDPNDNASTDIVFTDFTGAVFHNGSLPTSLSLSSFTDARVVGPVFGSSPFPATSDIGSVTQLILVPEPSSFSLLGLSLLALYARRLSIDH